MRRRLQDFDYHRRDDDKQRVEKEEQQLPMHSNTDESCKRKAWIFSIINGRRLITKLRLLKKKRAFLFTILSLLLGIVLFLFRVLNINDLYNSFVAKCWLRYYENFVLPSFTSEQRMNFIRQEILQNDKYPNEYIPIKRDDDTYDVFHCPPVPSEDYPRDYPIMDILNNWPIDDTLQINKDNATTIQSKNKRKKVVHQGLCVFDFASTDSTEVLKRQITAYNQAEVPYVIRNDPEVTKSVVRWNYNNGKYLFQLLGSKTYRGEVASTNHMMYWNINKGSTVVPKDFKRPTHMHPFTYPRWHNIASGNTNNNTNTSTTTSKQQQHHRIQADETHVYIRMDGCIKHKPCDSSYRRTGLSGKFKDTVVNNADFWYDELPFFKAPSELYIVKEEKQRGIQCRFGMEGLIAENHFDSDRNMIAVLGGERRYLLSHPRSCSNMYLYGQKHPMERHSQVDWSNPNVTKFPNFPLVKTNEVVLQPGDVLYLPTQWFHHIVSLNLNYQCNTRSGYAGHYEHHIRRCGFRYNHP